MSGIIKTKKELEQIAKAGAILGDVLKTLTQEVRPGLTPLEIDARAKELIEAKGGKPGFLGYLPNGATEPFPATICASVNDVIVHGVPNNTPLQEGDVFSIDCGVVYKGMNADAAITVIVGGKARDPKHQKLLEVTKKALDLGIAAAKAGNAVGDIGYAIERHVKSNGFKVVHGGLTGHGIGKNLHEDPVIFNEGEPGHGDKLLPGMAIAIEPMVAMGTSDVIQTSDEGYATKDGSMAAHFEHTIIILEDGPRVVT